MLRHSVSVMSRSSGTSLAMDLGRMTCLEGSRRVEVNRPATRNDRASLAQRPAANAPVLVRVIVVLVAVANLVRHGAFLAATGSGRHEG
jgi:hypothetical protein